MAKQTVIVTGASRGLGAAVARIAALMEANVVLTARSEPDLEAVARQIEASGGRALPVAGDLGQAADCQRIVAEAVQAFGQVDALVNNAGVVTPIAPIATADPQSWRENLAVNVLGPFMLTQAALPDLRKNKGRVVNVSTGAAVVPVHSWSAYSVAKAALNQLTRALAAEEPDVIAIAVRPGVVDTDMQATIRRHGATGMPAETYARFVRHHEQGELLPPEVPGCALAVLAFHAPQAWSGAFLSWDNEKVQSLVRRYACSPGG
jgi:NAD(P)-dependent dehydrogenase (short-subunit alcohol dehydrogenase family)